MKTDLLHDAITELPEDLVLSASGEGKEARRTRLLKVLVPAAAAALVLGVALPVAISNRNKTEFTWETRMKEPEAPGPDENEVAVEKRWDEKAEWERYRSLSLPDREETYDTTGTALSEAYRGAKLGTAVLTGQDIYSVPDIRTREAEVYRIEGISEQVAVAADLDGELFIYRNVDYRPETLGDMIRDYGMEQYMTFLPAEVQSVDKKGRVHTVTFEDFSGNGVFENLLSDGSVPCIFGDEALDVMTKRYVGFGVNIERAGVRNLGVWVTEEGYLVAPLAGPGKAFFIGKEAVEAFRAQLIRECRGVEYIYPEPDDTDGYEEFRTSGYQDAADPVSETVTGVTKTENATE